MDPQLLAALPDAAKLNILGLLGSQLAAPAAPTRAATPGGGAAAADDASGSVPQLLAGRRLSGGVAVIDGFLDAAEVKAAREEAQSFLQQRARPMGMVAAQPGQQWAAAAIRGDTAAWLPGARALEEGGHPRLAAAAARLAALRPWLAQQGYDVGGRASLQLARYPGGGARYVRHRDRSASVPYRQVTAILYLNPDWAAEHGGCLCVYGHSTAGEDPCAASAADLRLAGGAAAAGAAGAATAAAAAGSRDGVANGDEATATEPGSGGAPAAAAQAQEAQQQVPSGLDEGHPATVVPPLGGRLVVMDSRLLHEVLPAQAERHAIAAWFSQAPPPPATAAAAAAAAAGVAAAATGAAAGAGAGAAKLEAGAEAAAAEAPAATATVTVLNEQSQQQQQQQQQRRPGTAAEAAAPLNAAPITAPGQIFVSIPAYRDSEAQWTLADLFAKAAHPERVRVGICWQVQLPEDAHLMRLAGDQRWLPQVRQVVLPAGEATGPCKARALAHALWEGEEYHLQVDSHMRFVQGWDAALLRQLRQAERAAGHRRVVLSHYPPGYEGEGPDTVLPAAPLPVVLCASGWGEADGLLRLAGRKLKEPLAAPAPALFWAAGLSFSRAQLLLEAPYPRELPWLFFGEELLQLQRLWRAGWDVFAPAQPAAFHLWSRAHRPVYSRDREPDPEQRARSQRRVAAALAGGEGGEAGAGGGSGSSGGSSGGCSRRSLQQFWDHVGVDFRSRRISERARSGGMPPEALLPADPLAACS